jgi:hypothetical protein
MGQANSKLRRGEGRYFHWCPGCREMHPLPDSWQFNGNIDNPTFSPSFKQEGFKVVRDAEGRWTGDWQRDAAGNCIPIICHYHIQNGQLMYCGDCSHELSGKTIPLPDLPEHLKDPVE